MTSPPEQITIACPNCGHVYTDWHRASINVDLDPALNDAAYLRDASTAKCPKCEHDVDLGTLVVKGDVWTIGGDR